jgi:hypothetical protein
VLKREPTSCDRWLYDETDKMGIGLRDEVHVVDSHRKIWSL